MIPQNDAPWGVNTSGLPATWESTNNPFASGSIYAYINDTSNTDNLGTRLMTTDDDSDPNGYGARITGAVTTFSFDFFEPSDAAGDDRSGVKFGYSSADDMNSSEKSFAADLEDGMLGADNGIGAPADVPYALNTVHRIWMVANDSAAPLVDYMGGQTLDAGQADVWISLGGAAPVYAFSVSRVNPGPHGAGFRSFTGNISELLVDNVRIDTGVAIPEPAGLGVLSMGAVGLLLRRRRSR